jgi:crotonobetainyl-CoA:carnitine CoA-transferase CaiB-like acyl-CoA transferase
LQDPQVQAREMVISIPHPSAGTVRMVASPLKIPTAPTEVRFPPPRLGEHTEQVLCDLLGYDQQAVQRLRDAQVI